MCHCMKVQHCCFISFFCVCVNQARKKKPKKKGSDGSMLHGRAAAAGTERWGSEAWDETEGEREEWLLGKSPGSVQITSASHYSLCVVLVLSLCGAKRPSDLKVSPFDTTRPPVVPCWRRQRVRKTERGEEWREKQSQRGTWRETLRHRENYWNRSS